MTSTRDEFERMRDEVEWRFEQIKHHAEIGRSDLVHYFNQLIDKIETLENEAEEVKQQHEEQLANMKSQMASLREDLNDERNR